MEDKYNLQRFVKAQQQDFSAAYMEVSLGRKRSHWMWYVFPQITGLGMTSTSQYYSIKSAEEAKAYMEHPYLGENMRRICKALLSLQENDPHKIFGTPDDLKLCSSMTLFARTVPEEPLFQQVLEQYYDGRRDERTIEILKRMMDK